MPDPDALLRKLRIHGPLSAVELCRFLGVSQPTLSRQLRQISPEGLLRAGKARATRYAARRQIPGVVSPIPVYAIQQRPLLAGWLYPIHPRGFYIEGPMLEARFFPDLPWFLDPLRPSGFLGRFLPRQHPELNLPPDIRLWDGDDVLRYQTRQGWNPVGGLIVGQGALEQYEQDHPRPGIPLAQRSSLYAEMSRAVLQGGVPGSSAGGEHPKFLAEREDGVSVLVKFSPPVSESVGRRWADLLISEHLALQVLSGHGQPAATSELIEAEDRIFLEVRRFDRLAGARQHVVSLQAASGEWVSGDVSTWSAACHELATMGLLPAASATAARWLEAFGRLIANTDMHHANLSLLLDIDRIRDVAPAYDMLPMLYAPRGGEVIPTSFSPRIRPEDEDIRDAVRQAAADFWAKVARHPLISSAFAAIATDNLALITR